MLTIYTDTILKIAEFLTDREKIYLTMSSKRLDEMTYKLKYCEKIHIIKILSVPFFDNFESIEISCSLYKIPKHVKYIHHVAHDTLEIPPNVTHLTFCENFSQSIKNIIP